MLCDNCKKNQAAVFMEQVSGGEKTELNLCYKCSLDISTPMFLNNILKGMFYNSNVVEGNNVPTLSCTTCSLKLSEFKQTGKIGCSNCYQTFKREINSILRNIQWGIDHRGKIPKKNAANLILKKEVKRLRSDLNMAIDKEEYEEAARLRDKIKAIESGD